MIKKSKSDHRGFTLLEILLAVSLYAVALLILTGSLQGGIAVWKRDSTQPASVQPMDFFFAKMSQELENHVLFKPLPFEGKKNEIWLTCLVNKVIKHEIGPYFVRIHYWMEGDKLMREETNAETVLDRRKISDFLPVRTEWLSQIRKIEIRYAYFNQEKRLEWKDEWEQEKDQATFPTALKIRLEWVEETNRFLSIEKTFMIPDGWKKIV